MRKYIVGLLVVILLSGTVVYAANYLYHANEVSYTSNNKNWDVDNVKDALDELYSKIDNGVTVCNSSSTSENPILKYEATGTADDYIYECINGEWTRLKKLGYRWNGIILDNGTYDSEWYSTTWSKSESNVTNYGYVVGSSSHGSGGQVFSIHAKNNDLALGWTEFVMQKPINVNKPCTITIWYSYSLPAGDTTYRVPLLALKTSQVANGADVYNAGSSGTKAPSNSIASQKLTTNNSFVTFTISSENINKDLYLSSALGIYVDKNTSTTNTLTIKKIMISFT